jgi:lipopolysaccharide assembly protein A
MRFLCLLFLLAFAGAVAAFAWQNQHDVTVTFFNWGYTGSLALIVGAAYLLGMLSGWSVVGMLRRSFGRASQLLEERQAVR